MIEERIMCDSTKYHELDQRVDAMDRRLTAVETNLADMRAECKSGFEDLKSELHRVYEERSKWGEWARANLGTALKWLGAIVLAACGITQASTIIKLFQTSAQ